MNTVKRIAFVLAPIALFGGAVFWAFGRKRKKRLEQRPDPVPGIAA